eukprot:CAMPEP_0177402188 /NCGR_PEP_ID=MMETSP0368-20130122/60059_1 /TAXON_ID=447022 ORGANISM="Scrippsiella hangoei-like, Strain SHHI-4" /NCGR_SAMPLE_ID=MMETSP0368 /ASSEMBLY_ACC=CAM_ASM_000363 /LENGTH=93 /DNA_ID=CAMNT_0018869837 /DNA_START=332 /DNA_END=609 /DNA_ORIENTATION=-
MPTTWNNEVAPCKMRTASISRFAMPCAFRAAGKKGVALMATSMNALFDHTRTALYADTKQQHKHPKHLATGLSMCIQPEMTFSGSLNNLDHPT